MALLEQLGGNLGFPILSVLSLLLYTLYNLIYKPLISTPLKTIPGPKIFATTRWRLALEDWKGTRTPKIHSLHDQYGPAIRIGPNEISFNSLTALKTIYGAGSPFERTDFYRMFDVYGHQNMFTFASSKAHGQRKKLLNHAYSKSAILSKSTEHSGALMIEEKTRKYLKLLENEAKDGVCEIYETLHYFSLDVITNFLYGEEFGGTSALDGVKEHRALLDDISNPARRKLSWFAVHFPRHTKWLYTRTGLTEKIITLAGLLPMAKPATYTGIRLHALKSCLEFAKDVSEGEADFEPAGIMGRLFKQHSSQRKGGLEDLEIASECADQLLAGIDTTSDTIMFLIWALSLPANRKFQERLVEEISEVDDLASENDFPSAEASDRLPYLGAVIKETLRLYAPLPASEPRSMPGDTSIDGFAIPAKTVVGMSPYSLHRNPKVFRDPLRFDPERWLGDESELSEMKKWWWAFSSGGRMCIGIHLAMAEMTTLVAAIYSQYNTSVLPVQESVAPGITSRFEVFSDESFDQVSEHKCYIKFTKRK